MTDLDMDERLRAAGEAWRSTQARPTETGEVWEITGEQARPPVRRRRAWLGAAAAAVVAAVGVTVGLVATGPVSTPVANADQLYGVTWHLQSYLFHGRTYFPVSTGDPVNLTLQRTGRIGYSDGCNGEGGKLEVDGNTLLVTDVAATLVGCIGPSIARQQNFLNELIRGRSSWQVDGTTLTLSSRKIGSATFTSAPVGAGSVDELLRRLWILQTVDGKEQTAYGEQTLRFVGHAALYDDGCTENTAAITIDGHAIQVRATGHGPAGDNSCTGGVGVGATFTGTVQWSITGQKLTLSGGGHELAYSAQPPPTGPTTSTEPHDLRDTSWILSGVSAGIDTSVTSATLPFVRLRFDRSTSVLTLGDGSSIRRPLTLGDGTMDLSNHRVAPSGCTEQQSVLKALTGTANWQRFGGQLTISTTGGGHLYFIAGDYPAVPGADLSC